MTEHRGASEIFPAPTTTRLSRSSTACRWAFDALAAFDGSVVAEGTTGELSARCHDEQANLLALDLAHEFVTGDRTVGRGT